MMSKVSEFVGAYDVPVLPCRTRKTWRTQKTWLALQTDRRLKKNQEKRISASKAITSSPFLCWFVPPPYLDSRQSRRPRISLADINTQVSSSENIPP